MKHIIVVTCFFIGLSGMTGAVRAKTLRAGEYSKASVTEKDVEEAAAFAVIAQTGKMFAKESGAKNRIELVRVLAAQRQVVAGTNYRLKLQVKVNGETKQADVVVWWQPWRKTAPRQLTSWDWSGG